MVLGKGMASLGKGMASGEGMASGRGLQGLLLLPGLIDGGSGTVLCFPAPV